MFGPRSSKPVQENAEDRRGYFSKILGLKNPTKTLEKSRKSPDFSTFSCGSPITRVPENQGSPCLRQKSTTGPDQTRKTINQTGPENNNRENANNRTRPEVRNRSILTTRPDQKITIGKTPTTGPDRKFATGAF